MNAFITTVSTSGKKILDNDEEKIPTNNLSTVIGTLYDKRALAQGESTVNNTITINMSEEAKELAE